MIPIGCLLDRSDGRCGNQIWRASVTLAVAWANGTEPRFERSWPYREVFRMGETHPRFFVDRDELAELPQIDDHPALAHIPVRWRHYMQDRSLWWGQRGLVRAMLAPSAYARSVVDPLAADLFGAGSSIGVHVRRGDNVTNEPGSINLLPFDYYLDGWHRLADGNEAMYAMETVVFTDDPEFCRQTLPEHGAGNWRLFEGTPRAKELTPEYLTETPTDWVDLMLFADPRVDARVISNSSYVYWGAVLGGSPRVVFPSYWYGQQLTDAGARPDLLFGIPGWQSVAVDDPLPLPPNETSSLT